MAEGIIAAPIIGVRLIGADEWLSKTKVRVKELPINMGTVFAMTASVAASNYAARAPRSDRSRMLKPTSRQHFRDGIRPEVIAKAYGAMGAVVTNKPKLRVWLRDGTRAHEILPRRKSALRFMGAGGQIMVRRSVNHPGVWGTSGNPHWEDRAFEDVQPILVEAGRQVARDIVVRLSGATVTIPSD